MSGSVRPRTPLVFLIPAVALVTAGCAGIFGVEGSGNVVSESREVSGFDQIQLSGSGTVIVDVTGTESLSIETDDNLLTLLETEVDDGRLELRATRNIDPSEDVVYTITAASLTGVSISGSGSIVVTGVDDSAFSADISGSGAVTAEGTVSDALSVDISGSGHFEGEDLVAVTGAVNVSGSGSAVVNVTDDLAVSLSGSGDVEYLGSPTVDVDKSGSGTVTGRS
jgi:hypothetical protein